jgi:hypothetical protein
MTSALILEVRRRDNQSVVKCRFVRVSLASGIRGLQSKVTRLPQAFMFSRQWC